MKRFLEGSLLPADEAHTYWNGTFSEAQQRNLLRGPRETTIAELYDEYQPGHGSGSSLNRYLAFDQRYYLCDDILQKVDRMSMAHSLEVRPPFLDHRIVEFAASLPEKFKIRGSQKKLILRYLMKSKLPPGVLRQRKNGLDIPTHDWLRGSLRSLLLDTLSTQSIEETGLFQPGKIESLIQDHMSRRANVGYHLWGLLILFLWMKQWNIKTVSEPGLFRETLEDVSVVA
jgi:asparagine synthase (glutamine-hydrolysing)